jgi:hypothetical protein
MTISDSKSAFGTTLSRAGNTIARLTNIGLPEISLETLDVTSHQSDYGFKEYIGSLLDGGEVSIEGFYSANDTNGQIALLTDMINKTLQDFVITLPDAVATTFTFKALVTKYKIGDAPVDGAIPFSAGLKISGKPVLGVTASTGLTTPFFTVSGAGTLIVPAASGSVYNYTVNIANSVASVTITPTATAGVITITANGASQVVTSGQPSTAIALGAAGSITVATITVQETGKAAKVYTLDLTRAA